MKKAPIPKQVCHFIMHLRLHYQFFILSGGYLLSSLFVEHLIWDQFWWQFINVHVLLFGGATAYNSYWDKDEGPIGGLKSPPKMERWMWFLSLSMQVGGLIWAFSISTSYVIIYAVSLMLFWLYSTPLARWKGKPWLSILAIGISTGTNSFLMGYIAGSGLSLSFNEGIIAFGVACIILSLYPVSQLFQFEEDRNRGDITFAIKYGLKGVRRLYVLLFPMGVLLISWLLYLKENWMGMLFFFASVPAFIYISIILWRLEGKEHEYAKVMRIKFLASLSFVLFILSMLLYKSII